MNHKFFKLISLAITLRQSALFIDEKFTQIQLQSQIQKKCTSQAREFMLKYFKITQKVDLLIEFSKILYWIISNKTENQFGKIQFEKLMACGSNGFIFKIQQNNEETEKVLKMVIVHPEDKQLEKDIRFAFESQEKLSQNNKFINSAQIIQFEQIIDEKKQFKIFAQIQQKGIDMMRPINFRQTNENLKILEFLEIMQKIIEGFYLLNFKQNFVHGDIKPENIIMVEDKGNFEPKIIDFDFTFDVLKQPDQYTEKYSEIFRPEEIQLKYLNQKGQSITPFKYKFSKDFLEEASALGKTLKMIFYINQFQLNTKNNHIKNYLRKIVNKLDCLKSKRINLQKAFTEISYLLIQIIKENQFNEISTNKDNQQISPLKSLENKRDQINKEQIRQIQNDAEKKLRENNKQIMKMEIETQKKQTSQNIGQILKKNVFEQILNEGKKSENKQSIKKRKQNQNQHQIQNNKKKGQICEEINQNSQQKMEEKLMKGLF